MVQVGQDTEEQEKQLIAQFASSRSCGAWVAGAWCCQFPLLATGPYNDDVSISHATNEMKQLEYRAVQGCKGDLVQEWNETVLECISCQDITVERNLQRMKYLEYRVVQGARES